MDNAPGVLPMDIVSGVVDADCKSDVPEEGLIVAEDFALGDPPQPRKGRKSAKRASTRTSQPAPSTRTRSKTASRTSVLISHPSPPILSRPPARNLSLSPSRDRQLPGCPSHHLALILVLINEALPPNRSKQHWIRTLANRCALQRSPDLNASRLAHGTSIR